MNLVMTFGAYLQVASVFITMVHLLSEVEVFDSKINANGSSSTIEYSVLSLSSPPNLKRNDNNEV